MWGKIIRMITDASIQKAISASVQSGFGMLMNVSVSKNPSTILAFSCGVRPLLMPFPQPPASGNIRIQSILV